MTDINTVVKFDIIGFAQNILSEVDKIRAFDKEDDGTKEGVTRYVESRLNAFFRLVGLPMFVTKKKKTETSSGGKEGSSILMTPGYSQTSNRDLWLYDVSNSSDNSDLGVREETLLKREFRTGEDDMNAAMTSAIRYPLPLLANLSDAGYGIVGVLADERNAYKKLEPLITSYIPDGIRPIRNQMARPFLRDPQEQRVDDETAVPKPFIEVVIRTRLVSCESGQAAQQQTTQQEFTKSIQDYVGDDLYKQVAADYPELSTGTDILERFVITQLLGALDQLAEQWVAIQKKQEELRKGTTFQIVPQTASGKQNPFGKRIEVTADVETTTEPTDGQPAQKSTIGNQLKVLRAQQIQQETLLSLLPTDDIVTSDANRKTKNTKNVVAAALLNPFTTLVNSRLDSIQKQISEKEEALKNKAKELEDLRLRIEMMTGEFTGLSVPDVVIVIIALFMIDKLFLVQMLDQDCIDEMRKDPTLDGALDRLGFGDATSANAMTSVFLLEALVDNLYSVLNRKIKECRDKKSRNEKVAKKKKK